MEIQSIRIASFRAHPDTRIDLAPGVNLFYGPNGAGKTNVLEAVHYVCLTKSFLATQDAYALRTGSAFFEVEAAFAGRHRSQARARIVYARGEGKRVFVNSAPLERLSEIVGQFPVVVASPGDYTLTAEGPEIRRRFMDNILSQSKPVYLDDLVNYRRALKQRNVLLTRYRRAAMPAGLLDSWDAELVQLGSRVILGRLRFIRAFTAFLEEAYTQIEAVGEHPRLAYETIGPLDEADTIDAVASCFNDRLARAGRREREMGRTLVGPHHDEIVFSLNEMEVRRYASQGQHRLFGLALRLAQYFYLKAQLDEEPILLLDDLFGNLDARRSEIVLRLLRDGVVGQSLVTATGREPFVHAIPFEDAAHRLFYVEAGRVRQDPHPTAGA
ncbi:MAG: DNA replication/repair protein RecF [Rhodothermales bacterium]